MPLNSSGQLSLGGSVTGESISLQLGLSPTAQVSLNDAAVRALAGIPEGPIRLPIDFWGKPAGSPSTDKGLFAFGNTGAVDFPFYTQIVNQISNLGFFTTDQTVVAAKKAFSTGLTYGGDKGIVKFGFFVIVIAGPQYRSFYTNGQCLISNTGVVATEVTGTGTVRAQPFGCSYGDGLASFIFGGVGVATYAVRNNVTTTGVVSSDTAATGTARTSGATVNFGVGQSLLAYGEYSTGGGSGRVYPLLFNTLSDTGVISSDGTAVGPTRVGSTGCSYGNGKGIIAYGVNAVTLGLMTTTNLVSDTGVIASNTDVVGTLRGQVGGCSFGGDKGMFAYGGSPTGSPGIFTVYNISNRVSTTGVISSDAVGIGTARLGVAGCGYGLAP